MRSLFLKKLQFQVCNNGEDRDDEEEGKEENTLEAGGALGLRADISTLCLDSQVVFFIGRLAGCLTHSALDPDPDPDPHSHSQPGALSYHNILLLLCNDCNITLFFSPF